MRRALLTLLGVLCIMQLMAQNRTVSGKITDEKGNGIPNASITIKGSRVGTTADVDGNFRLSIPANANTLTVSSAGFDVQEIPVGNNSTFSVVLTTRNESLNEVVVTSLGIARDKRSLGYATQKLNSDQLANRGQTNVVSSLEGKVAGVQITGASGSAGESAGENEEPSGKRSKSSVLRAR